MEVRLNITEQFTNGRVTVFGFVDDAGILYVRMRQLMTLAMDGSPCGKEVRDALCSGLADYAKTKGRAYGVLCYDQDKKSAVRRLYVNKKALQEFLDQLDPMGPEADLLCRASSIFDGLSVINGTETFEPREYAYRHDEAAEYGFEDPDYDSDNDSYPCFDEPSPADLFDTHKIVVPDPVKYAAGGAAAMGVLALAASYLKNRR